MNKSILPILILAVFAGAALILISNLMNTSAGRRKKETV